LPTQFDCSPEGKEDRSRIPIHHFADRRLTVKLRERVLGIMVLAGISALATTPAFAQTRNSVVTVRFAAFSPIVALIAGILILIFPRLLNYIVAIYLILIGLIGLLGR
jgi:hypothetical protein